MPGRVKAGLDGAAWEKIPDTETAIRRQTTTGVEARSRDNRTYLDRSRDNRTYLEATSPKIRESKKEEKVNQKDPGALSLLSDPPPGENKEDIISRIKMVKEEIDVGKDDAEGIDLGKADEGKIVVSKVNQNDDEEILDDDLEHVLCFLFYPSDDERSSKMRKIFLQHGIKRWDEFMLSNKQDFQASGLLTADLRMIHCRSYS